MKSEIADYFSRMSSYTKCLKETVSEQKKLVIGYLEKVVIISKKKWKSKQIIFYFVPTQNFSEKSDHASPPGPGKS